MLKRTPFLDQMASSKKTMVGLGSRAFELDGKNRVKPLLAQGRHHGRSSSIREEDPAKLTGCGRGKAMRVMRANTDGVDTSKTSGRHGKGRWRARGATYRKWSLGCVGSQSIRIRDTFMDAEGPMKRPTGTHLCAKIEIEGMRDDGEPHRHRTPVRVCRKPIDSPNSI